MFDSAIRIEWPSLSDPVDPLGPLRVRGERRNEESQGERDDTNYFALEAVDMDDHVG